MVFPLRTPAAGRRLAATTAAPELIPAGIPSSSIRRRALMAVTGHLFDAVQQAQIQVARDEAGADALDLVRTRFDLHPPVSGPMTEICLPRPRRRWPCLWSSLM